ncbi:MAG TPA: hypothetical protein DGT23_21535, partial [Micromonosporaceae bacterium]|nr:hypothetical protein [Micromonosporaceae bacterium]
MNIAIAVLVTLAAALAAEGSPAGWATAAAIGLPLALRTRWPISALAVVLTAVGFAVVGGVIPLYAAAVPYLALALALFTVGDRTPRRRSLAVLGTATVAVFAIGLSVSLAFAAGGGGG